MPFTVRLRLPEGFRESSIDEAWTINPDLTLQFDNTTSVIEETGLTYVPD